jgi:cyclophilin family peptidyl-prolyl cis-trans isomerase
VELAGGRPRPGPRQPLRLVAVSKRRVTPTGTPAAEARRGMRPLVALAISAVVVALVIGAGVGIDWVIGPHPSAAFAKCRTAPPLAPNLYTGPPPMCIDTNATYSGTLKTTKGDISMKFMAKQAPRTVNNFIVLAENGYFNGQTFWRSQDWVIQGGDPQANGRGGPGYSLPEEPPATDEQWPPGSMGMARFPDGSISGSQFFILKQAWQGGNPTAAFNHFATVSAGFDIVGQLDTSDRILSVEIKRT